MFHIWNKHIGEFPDKINIKEFVIKIQESGVTPHTTNSYIRGINAFLMWLHENEHTPELLRIKKIKEPEKVLKLFSEAQLKAFLSYKPKTFAKHRLYALTCLLIDTGARIEEVLGLTRADLDFENLFMTVKGKGNKERIIPISIECRKELYKFLKKHDNDLLFPARGSEKWIYRTALQQFKEWCAELGIDDVRTSFHTIRHTFASAYVRDGGNILYLQKQLGHADLSVTKIYVKAQPEDLKLMHKKTSLVTRLK